jgi:hypothetical protein
MWGSSRRNSGYNDSSYREGRRSAAAAMATGTAVVLIAASGGLLFCVARLVKEYGWHGALNYIWQGDPYPPSIRQALDDLSAMDQTLRQEEDVKNTLNRLEAALQRAKEQQLDYSSIDATATILATWEQHVVQSSSSSSSATQQHVTSLQTILATLSYNLDRWAAKIDGIHITAPAPGGGGGGASGGEEYAHDAIAANLIKVQKKELSNRIVQMMERTDVLLTFWKEATAATK